MDERWPGKHNHREHTISLATIGSLWISDGWPLTSTIWCWPSSTSYVSYMPRWACEIWTLHAHPQTCTHFASGRVSVFCTAFELPKMNYPFQKNALKISAWDNQISSLFLCMAGYLGFHNMQATVSSHPAWRISKFHLHKTPHKLKSADTVEGYTNIYLGEDSWLQRSVWVRLQTCQSFLEVARRRKHKQESQGHQPGDLCEDQLFQRQCTS